jgi:hypothetical protein
MMQMPDSLKKIENMSWDSLIQLATEELDTIPEEKHIVLETQFNRRWPELIQMILSLPDKSYEDITIIRRKLGILGKLSSDEKWTLAWFGTLNKSRYKSTKVEYYLICRHLHTKRR